MKVIWIFVLVALVGLEYTAILGAPLTKWFKTDNNTYYIEEQINYTFQQSYDECQKKNMGLITLKTYKEDELLLKYLAQTFDPQPEFWLNAVEKVDMQDINKLLDSFKLATLLNIKLDGVNEPQIIQSNNPNNCAVNVEGATKDCDILRGFICHENNTKTSGGGQNIQNIVLKFN
ncbi:uncharacterized protein LOC119612520 [Lucilia sericata]|uniref:uncharacterized protein LOC119612520 n=1 Tax=Lucilia sericata TaxID=13632 RepID=UPI0018A869E6|nr:uncharacterized protein LOC119612520 [Lucilia sericata]